LTYNAVKGELIEMFGFGRAVVNENLQLYEVEIFYNAEDFISNLQGKKRVEDTNTSWNTTATCPFATKRQTGGSETGCPIC
jgi:hypothetical protein